MHSGRASRSGKFFFLPEFQSRMLRQHAAAVDRERYSGHEAVPHQE
jgi:hypothetical protein